MEKYVRISWVNCIIATCCAALLAWWLWYMGLMDLQKWLLAALGGFLMEVGFVGGIGLKYNYPRSGIQARIVFMILGFGTFTASVVYSFFLFSAPAYCVPMGIFFLLCLFMAMKIIKSKE